MFKCRRVLSLLAVILSFQITVCSAEEAAGAQQQSGPPENQEAAEDFVLDPVVVTATRVAASTMDVPASVTVITGEEIARKNVKSVGEILKNDVGIIYDSVYERINMRGRSDDNIMVLVDGVPSFNQFNSESNLDSVAVSNIERIEVARGASSTLYGGNAVSGVINIITKNADKDSASVRLGVGSDNTWIKDINFYKKVNDKFGFGMGWEAKDSDGYMQKYARVAPSSIPSPPVPSVTQPTGTVGYGDVKIMSNGDGRNQYMVGEKGRKGYDKDNYWLKMNYDFDQDKRLSYAFSYYKWTGETTGAKSYITDADGNPLYAGVVQLPGGQWVKFAASAFNDYINRKEVITHSLRYHDKANDFTASLGLADMRDAGYNSGNNFNKNLNGTLARYPGKTYHMDVQKIWKDLGKHTIIGGFTYRQDEMNYENWELAHWGDQSSKNKLNNDAGGENRSTGIFVQDEYSFSDRWKLFAGIRYDSYDMKNGYSTWYGDVVTKTPYTSESYNEISPKVALEMKPNDTTSIYISYGHSFRPPDLYQLYRISSYSNDDYYYIGNPSLTPETSDTFEIGVKKQIAKKADISLTFFQSKTKDAIVAVNYPAGHFPWAPDLTREVRAYTNVDEENRRGVEFSARYRFNDKFNAFFNYTWQKSKVEFNGSSTMRTWITGAPEHLVKLGVNYNYQKWDIALDGIYASHRNGDDDTPTGIYYGSYDPYFIANFRLGYKVNDNLQLAFSVHNLFDKYYYEDYIAPGRTFMLEARFSF